MEGDIRYNEVIDLKKQNNLEKKDYKKTNDDDDKPQIPADIHAGRNIINLRKDGDFYYSSLSHGSITDIMDFLHQKLRDGGGGGMVDSGKLSMVHGCEITRKLKRGGFSRLVQLCLDKSTKQKFVRKQVSREKFKVAEVSHLCLLRHQNICRMFGLYVDTTHIDILLEYCGMSIRDAVMLKLGPTLFDHMKSILTQAGNALLECKSHNLLHLDLKPSNMCVRIHGSSPNLGIIIKLMDFGSSKMVSDELLYEGFTPVYASPELLYQACKDSILKARGAYYQTLIQITQDYCRNYQTTEVCENTDLFSLGLVCLFIKLQSDPYKCVKLHETIITNFAQLTKTYSVKPNVMQDLVAGQVWGSLTQLIQQLLCGDPAMRFNVADMQYYLSAMREETVDDHPVENVVNAIQPSDTGGGEGPEQMDWSPNVPNIDMLL
ncbi:calcium-dependent protein kinase 2-like [Argonauta hians]